MLQRLSPRLSRPTAGADRAPGWLPLLAATLSAATYAALSLARYDRLGVRSWDLAIFSQAAQSYVERGYPVADVKAPGFNLLADHFSPIVVLWAPLWAVVASPRTLLVAQAVLLGVSVGVVLAAAARHLGRAAGVAVGVAYALSFGLAEAADFDVHETAFAVPLLALAGSAYLRRDWSRVVVWSAPLLLVKEDQGLTIAAIGVALLLSGERRRGGWLLVGGALATLLVLLVLIPLLNPDGYDYWSRLTGGDATGAIGGASGDGLLGLPARAVWPPVKLETLLLTFGVTGFLALRSPWAVVAVPTLGWRFLSEYDYYWGTDWHYSLTLMPIVFVALVDGVVRARASTRAGWLRRYAAHGPAVALAVALALVPQLPLRDLASPATWEDTAREAAAESVVEMIPSGARVETDIGLMAPLVADHEVYFSGTNVGADAVTPDWIVVDTRLGWGGGDVATYAEQRWPGTDWQPVPAGAGYLLARRT